MICKPNKGRGSRDVHVLENNIQLSALRNAHLSGSELILQQLISGTEYTVQMIAGKDSALRAVVPVRIITKKE